MTTKVKVGLVGLLAASIFLTGGIGVFRSSRTDPEPVRAAANIDSASVLSPADAGSSVSGTIALLQQRLRSDPDDAGALASLGLAYVQQARITLDPSYYPKAEGVLERSLALQPGQNAEALIGMAALMAARHDFTASLEWGRRARAAAPGNASVYGVVGDAQLELGRYDAAFDSYQRMVDTRPDLSSYARVSYSRELLGDIRGAQAAMRAASRVAGTPSDIAWTSFQLGELAFNDGRLSDAATAYRRGADADPSYVANAAGLAKVAWARGERDVAIARYERVVARLPLPEHVIALGDAYGASGETESARASYDLVRVQQRLADTNGVNTDLELALFDADHGRPAAALRAARAEWQRRSSVHVADALAWALLANDRPEEAWTYARRALSLGTRNASFLFHAGMIRLALGDRDGARSFLADALATNPHFSIQHADEAAATLERLGGDAPQEAA